MKKYSAQDVLDQYTKSGLIMHDVSASEDYKIFNREGNKIIKMYKYLEKDIDLADETLPRLFNHEDVVVRSKAAAHCLGLNIHTKEAEVVLEKISHKKENGFYRLNAELTLKTWHEQGYLKFYQTKEDRENLQKGTFGLRE